MTLKSAKAWLTGSNAQSISREAVEIRRLRNSIELLTAVSVEERRQVQSRVAKLVGGAPRCTLDAPRRNHNREISMPLWACTHS